MLTSEKDRKDTVVGECTRKRKKLNNNALASSMKTIKARTERAAKARNVVMDAHSASGTETRRRDGSTKNVWIKADNISGVQWMVDMVWYDSWRGTAAVSFHRARSSCLAQHRVRSSIIYSVERV